MSVKPQNKFHDASQIFAEASTSFRDGLSFDDRAKFTTYTDGESMLDSVKKEAASCSSGEKRERLLKFCSKIDQFVQKIEPFFKTIDIFVSTHPEWAGIAWGAMRLLFQLSSNYTTFIDKIGSMIERFADKLPRYSRRTGTLLELLRAAKTSKAGRISQESLLKSFALVYNDILQFLFDACKMFSTKNKGMRYKAGLILDVFWTPFDVRFSNILDRLSKHEKLLELEWTISEADINLSHANLWERELESIQIKQKEMAGELETLKMNTLYQRVMDLKRWIDAPSWTPPFNSAKSRWKEDTGTWIFKDPIFKAWLAEPLDINTRSTPMLTSPRRVLWTKGKPGFGKTVLAMQMIQHLQKIRPQSNSRRTTVAYFFFDGKKSNNQHSSNAIRAISTQLLHIHQENEIFIDIASLLMRFDGCGQKTASDEELWSLFHLILQRLEHTYIVIDGLDECLHWGEFIDSLSIACEDTSCKVAIFSRQNIGTVKNTSAIPFEVDLGSSRNLEDIKSYLEPEIRNLVASGAFSEELPAKTIVSDISNRADSMFLWAVLMIAFLKSPALTPVDRTTAIQNLNLFEGLEALYSKILQDLRARFKQRQEQRNISRILNMVCVAPSPFPVDVLHRLFVIKVGRATAESHLIQDFDNLLLAMCGSLVEIRPDRTVQFVHLSVYEYLLSDTLSESIDASFQVRRSEAHLSLASTYLSYLVHDVPAEPLSGSSSSTPCPEVVSSNLPLLPLASVWQSHAADGINDMIVKRELVAPDILRDFGLCMEAFLTSKATVNVWIEASWLFQTQPDTSSLSAILRRAQNKITEWTPIKDQFVDLAQRIHQFTQEISELNQAWGHVLAMQPNEIWEPSISAFNRNPKFWLPEKKATISSLETAVSDTGISAISIASQVSSDGSEVALIKLLPSEKYRGFSKDKMSRHLSLEKARQTARPFSSGWKVVYKVWSLESRQQVFYLVLDISPKQIENQLCRALMSESPERFEFSVAFSSCLRIVSILGSIFRLSYCETSGEAVFHHQQELDLGLSEEGNQYLQKSRSVSRRVPTYLSSSPCIPEYKYSRELKNEPRWQNAVFSPDGKQVLLIQGKDRPVKYDYWGVWALTVFVECNCQDSPAHFRRTGTTFIHCNPSATKAFAFHPTEPVMAITTISTTSIWKYQEQDIKLANILLHPLSNLIFSSCGKFLSGDNFGARRGSVVISLAEHGLTRSTPIDLDLDTQDCKSIGLHNPKMTSSGEISTGKEKTAIIDSTSTVISFNTSTAPNFMSVLEHHEDTSSIILRSSEQTGWIRSAVLTRLPKSKTIEQTYSTLLPPRQEFDTLRLVLNLAMQDSYDVREQADLALPAILERQKDTIPTFVTSLGSARQLEEGGDEEQTTEKQRRKRDAGWGVTTPPLKRRGRTQKPVLSSYGQSEFS